MAAPEQSCGIYVYYYYYYYFALLSLGKWISERWWSGLCLLGRNWKRSCGFWGRQAPGNISPPSRGQPASLDSAVCIPCQLFFFAKSKPNLHPVLACTLNPTAVWLCLALSLLSWAVIQGAYKWSLLTFTWEVMPSPRILFLFMLEFLWSCWSGFSNPYMIVCPCRHSL